MDAFSRGQRAPPSDLGSKHACLPPSHRLGTMRTAHLGRSILDEYRPGENQQRDRPVNVGRQNTQRETNYGKQHKQPQITLTLDVFHRSSRCSGSGSKQPIPCPLHIGTKVSERILPGIRCRDRQPSTRSITESKTVKTVSIEAHSWRHRSDIGVDIACPTRHSTTRKSGVNAQSDIGTCRRSDGTVDSRLREVLKVDDKSGSAFDAEYPDQIAIKAEKHFE